MKLTLRQVHIQDPQSPFHNSVCDIRINGNNIESIATTLPAADGYSDVNLDKAQVSPGWFDSSVCFGEPGYEERETIANGLKVAAASGFTAVALQPYANPVIDNQAAIRFVKEKAKGHATELYPIGALTKGAQGEELAELYDMKNAGALAFGDYKKSVVNTNLLKIALQYVQDFDGRLLMHAEDAYLKGTGVVHEGETATRLGMKSIPALAESVTVARNLHLLEYTGGSMHIPMISTAESVALIREAKKKGLNVSCSVAVHNLCLTDDLLVEFDTNAKVNPPLRDEQHRQALIEGVLDGTIDCVSSDHNPLDVELKKMEFDQAKNGTIGLESAFSALNRVLPLEHSLRLLTAARPLFGFAQPSITVGAAANLTLFQTDGDWTFSRADIRSASKNSVFLNQPMKGKVLGIYNHGQLHLNS